MRIFAFPLYYKTNPSLYYKNDAFDYLATYIISSNTPIKTAALRLARGWYAPGVSFIHPGVVPPSVQGPQWSLVWGLVSSTALSRI